MGEPPADREAVFTPAERASLRYLLISSALSKTADWQLGIVIPLAVLAVTDSVAASLLTFAVRTLAYAASPVIGSVVDRFDRATVFTLAQFQQALCLMAAALLIAYPVALSMVLFLSGIGAVASSIAGQFVLVPQLFSGAARPNAAARLGSVIEFSKVLGMLVGGVLAWVASPAISALCTALWYAAAGWIARGLPRETPAPTPSSLRADLAIGITWLRRPEIFWLVASLSVMNLASGNIETVLVTAFDRIGLAAVVTSIILAAGLLLSGVSNRLAMRLMPASTPERRILTCQALHVSSLLMFCVPGTAAKVVAYALHSFATGAINYTTIVYRQNVIPVELAGRVNATMRMLITGSISLSALVFAAAGHLPALFYWVPSLILMTLAALISAVRVTWPISRSHLTASHSLEGK